MIHVTCEKGKGAIMDTRYLEYITTLGRTCNMTKTAEELFVTQSSISQYLSKLEKELEVPLFLRKKNVLVPTPAGELYIQFANKVIDEYTKLKRQLKSLDNSGHISIGITSNWGMEMISQIIPKFNKQYSNVAIEVFNDSLPQILKLIAESKIDLAVASVNSMSAFQEDAELLWKEEVLFAMPANHEYCKNKNDQIISSKDIIDIVKNSCFYQTKKGSSLRFLADDFFEENHYTPKSMYEMNVISALQNMIEAGNGVAFIAESCVKKEQKIRYFSVESRLYRYNVLIRKKGMEKWAAEDDFVEMMYNYWKC